MNPDPKQLDSQRRPTQGDIRAACDFERFIPLVFGWARRLTHDRDLSMDVVQDVFLKWNRQCEDAAPARPEAWLRTVTTRRVFEVLRSPRLRVVQLDPDRQAETIDADRTQAGPDDELLRDDVIQALETLTEMQRDVVLAKIMDQKTFAAIATDFDVAVSTIKTHYMRAVRALRDALAGRWREP